MSIRTKLMCGFGGVLLLVLVQGFVLFWFGSRVEVNLTQVESSSLAEADAGERMLNTLSQLDGVLQEHAESIERFGQAESALEEERAELSDGFQSHLLAALHATRRGLELAAQDARGEWDREQDQIQLLNRAERVVDRLETTSQGLTSESSPDDVHLAREEMRGLGAQLEIILDRFRDGAVLEVQDELRQAATNSRDASRYLLIGSLLAVVVALGVSLLLARIILRPLHELVGAAREIEEGNHQRRLAVGRKDEFGVMALAFNRMLDSWQEATVTQEELERTVEARTRQLREAAAQIQTLNTELATRVETQTFELNESERRHSALLANLQGMAYRCRFEPRRDMQLVSDGCMGLLGIEPETLRLGPIPYGELIHVEDRERAWERLQKASATGLSFGVQYRVRRSDDSWRWVWDQGQFLRNEQDEIIALEGYITDITERIESERSRQRLEYQLREAQKMEAIGTLAGGIAHDFNNVLGVIVGNAELATIGINSQERVLGCLAQVLTAANRARDLVKQILTFSRPTAGERDVTRLQPILAECVQLLRATIPAMVELQLRTLEDSPPILADPTQVHQVIMNICTNAWQALPEIGGRIEVALEEEHLTDTVAAQTPNLPEGRYLRVSIADNGLGMDPATMERIFDPFFTTKPAGEGTGLGLSVVHGIMKSHQGAIAVQSTLGQGTVFHLYFPAQPHLEEEPVAQPQPIPRGNGEHVLLVDDEEAIGIVTEQYLLHLGYCVTRHHQPETALDEFCGSPLQFDAVITDQAMPGMPGTEVVAALRRLRADIPILLTSGFLDSTAMASAHRAGVNAMLIKPLTLETLGRAVSQLLVRATAVASR